MFDALNVELEEFFLACVHIRVEIINNFSNYYGIIL